MKVLVDNALSPRVSHLLNEAGYDSVHVREHGLHASSDSEILQYAQIQGRVIVSADTDFGALLAVPSESYPSFILFRKSNGVRPDLIASQLIRILKEYVIEIEKGCIITVTDTRIRIRTLPIGD
jgi:predicted nuclease of predicted toxin-antitoxin system